MFGIVIFSGIAIIIYSLLRNYRSNLLNETLISGTVVIAIGIIIWIRRKITLSYKEMIKEDTIKQLENELNEERETNSNLLSELEKLTMINHKYSSRISALELHMQKLAYTLNNNAEFGTELSDATELIEKLSKEYSDEILQKIKHNKKLPKVNILGIDNIFEYMQIEASKNNIDFSLKVNHNIHYMTQKLISPSKLETLIGDHVKDAIIAINSSTNNFRSIMAMFDIVNNCYEFRVYDSGIEFEINTLLKLGLAPVTTHKDNGGTGMGFMTTFETLNECNASLIIEERKPDDSSYTKAVIIRFDGKNEYKILSYRANEIKKENINGRVIVEEL